MSTFEYRWSVRTRAAEGRASPRAIPRTVLIEWENTAVFDAAEASDTFAASGELLFPGQPVLLTPPDESEIFASQPNTFTWQAPAQAEVAFRRFTPGVLGIVPDVSLVGITEVVFTNQRNEVEFSPAGGLLAVGTRRSEFFSVFDTANWQQITGTPVLPSSVLDVSYNADGSLLAIAHGSLPSALKVFNTSDWSEVATGLSLPGNPLSVCFSPAGDRLAIGHLGGKLLTVVTTTDWQVIADTPTLIDHESSALSFSPDGGTLVSVATASSANNFYAIDTTNWTLITGLPTVSGGMRSCTFSPDGNYVALARDTASTLIIDANTWQDLSVTFSPGGAIDVAFSPDGQFFAESGRLPFQGNTGFRLYNVSDWSRVEGHPNIPHLGKGVTFSPDSSTIVFLGIADPYMWVISNSGAFEYWNGTSWQSGEVFIAQTDQEITFPPDTWPVNDD